MEVKIQYFVRYRDQMNGFHTADADSPEAAFRLAEVKRAEGFRVVEAMKRKIIESELTRRND